MYVQFESNQIESNELELSQCNAIRTNCPVVSIAIRAVFFEDPSSPRLITN